MQAVKPQMHLHIGTILPALSHRVKLSIKTQTKVLRLKPQEKNESENVVC